MAETKARVARAPEPISLSLFRVRPPLSIGAMDARAARLARIAAKSIAREVKTEALATRKHIQLRNLPRTCLPSDLRRMVTANNVENVVNIAIEYQRFIPTHRAILEISDPILTQSALKALQGATVASMPVYPRVKSEEQVDAPTPVRHRGMRGREDAVERGAVLQVGDGPNGRLSAATSGRNVVVYGLPGNTRPAVLREYLRGFSFAANEPEKTQVQKLVGEDDRLRPTAKFLVRLSNESEAHRLVRQMHLTPFNLGEKSETVRHLVRARVIY